jgi:YggT family protein
MLTLVNLINIIAQLLMIIIILDVLLSYIVDPFNPVKLALDRFVHPMLTPIQKVVPPIGNIDFSPVILILTLQIINWVITSLILNIG